MPASCLQDFAVYHSQLQVLSNTGGQAEELCIPDCALFPATGNSGISFSYGFKNVLLCVFYNALTLRCISNSEFHMEAASHHHLKQHFMLLQFLKEGLYLKHNHSGPKSCSNGKRDWLTQVNLQLQCRALAVVQHCTVHSHIRAALFCSNFSANFLGATFTPAKSK